jgi:hypothetical protein
LVLNENVAGLKTAFPAPSMRKIFGLSTHADIIPNFLFGWTPEKLLE